MESFKVNSKLESAIRNGNVYVPITTEIAEKLVKYFESLGFVNVGNIPKLEDLITESDSCIILPDEAKGLGIVLAKNFRGKRRAYRYTTASFKTCLESEGAKLITVDCLFEE